MDRINGLDWIDIGGGKRGFRDESLAAGIPGTEVTAAWLNDVQENLLAVLEKSGIAPDAAAWLLLSRAIRSQAMNYRTAAGSANALLITLDPQPASWNELIGVPIRVKVPASNTAAAASLAVNNLPGTKPITRPGGVALRVNDYVADQVVEMVYDGIQVQLMGLSDSRLRRINVPAGGVSIGAADEGTTYFLDLATRQSMTLPNPASVPEGFSVIIETGTAKASGFQTASVAVAAGVGNTAIRFRGFDNTPFYLVGGGETFVFVSDGTRYRAYLLSPPTNGIAATRSATGQAQGAVAQAWSTPTFNQVSGAQFGGTGNRIIVPVTGLYRLYAKTTAGGSQALSVQQRIALFPDATGSGIPFDNTYVWENSSNRSELKVYVDEVLQQGQNVYVLYYGDPNGFIVGNDNFFSISLLDR